MATKSIIERYKQVCQIIGRQNIRLSELRSDLDKILSLSSELQRGLQSEIYVVIEDIDDLEGVQDFLKMRINEMKWKRVLNNEYKKHIN